MICVIDGMIDPCKICRNEKHNERQQKLKELWQIIGSKSPEGTCVHDLSHCHSLFRHSLFRGSCFDQLTTHTLRTLDQDPEDLKRFRKLQREAIRPNAQIISDFKSWTSSKKNFTVFGAPYQADAQMIYLLRKFSGWIQGGITYVFPCMLAC